MKTIKLNNYWSNVMANLPETGMGYQKVDILLKDGRTLPKVLVVNGQECQTDHEFTVDDIKEMTL